MIFVKAEDLKQGMRLAKPIYNKNGVKLYERDTKLTAQGIESINNFGLIGIYVLEPAEPVPIMTEEDIEFERFQTVSVFSLKANLQGLAAGKKAPTLNKLANDVISRYGRLDHKLNFVQNLRSPEDYAYKHSINVAILTALMANTLKMTNTDRLCAVNAALLHDVGRLTIAENRRNEDGDFDDVDLMAASYGSINTNFDLDEDIKKAFVQFRRAVEARAAGKKAENNMVTDVLLVAHAYDSLTAMRLNAEPSSEVQAMRFLMDEKNGYNTRVVNALIDSINILIPGVCIELTNGEKGLVLVENKTNILRPMVLLFKDNKVFDLAHPSVFAEVQIQDIMKTMDNRFVMDRSLLEDMGIK
ncbi:MAG: HD domain-containing protein [Lachnospiraceae bacterium]|nr:HD domain-containing protein [Lachnospiraceae bacterium]